MKKIGLLLLAIISVTALVSCKGSDAPDGMRLVYGGESAGYCFYAPEEWSIDNSINGINAAYASKLDSTSILFAAIDVKSQNKTEMSESDYFFSDYFDDSLKEFTIAPENIKKELEDIPFFGAEGFRADKHKAYSYELEYIRGSTSDTKEDEIFKIGVIEIYVEKSGSFYILKYTALLEERTSGVTYFEYHKDRFKSVIENFKFIEKKETTSDVPEYIKDPVDGYLLISDKSVAGFDLYVPDTFKPDFSSGMVSATHADGSNISITKAVSKETVTDYRYWEIKKQALNDILSEYIINDGETKEKVESLNTFGTNDKGEPIIKDNTVDFGNAIAARYLEYRFIYNGEVYHVYQVIANSGWALNLEGYVFTYTAKEENYESHIDEIKKIMEKVKF